MKKHSLVILANSFNTFGHIVTGSYFVMATDPLNDFGREFYQESPTLDGASEVTVAENDTALNIDFTLDYDGSISGKISNENGDPLQEVLVLAIRTIDEFDIDKLLLNTDLGFDTTDTNGFYHITGLSDGDYRLRTFLILNDPYNGKYLDEWYRDVYSLFAVQQAEFVEVANLSETPDINFTLEAAGIVSGKILNSDASAPAEDIAAIVAIDTSTSLPQLAPFEWDSNDGSYTISMLESGKYKLYAFVDPEGEGMFISEFYDGKKYYENGDVVAVDFGDTTKNIDFTLEKGGVIQGFVNLETQTTGADTLFGFPVVAYHSVTGEFAGAASVTFSGGYRIIGLSGGTYKVEAIPVMPPFAATYYGGGGTFADANTTVQVIPGNVNDGINIDLEKANGIIKGTVWDANNTPVNRPPYSILKKPS